MCRFLHGHKFSAPLCKYQGFIRLKHVKKLSSKVVVPTCILPRTNECSCCSASLSALGIVRIPNFGHSTRCVMMSHCFNLNFPDNIRCGTFSCAFFSSVMSSLVTYLLKPVVHFLIKLSCGLIVEF